MIRLKSKQHERLLATVALAAVSISLSGAKDTVHGHHSRKAKSGKPKVKRYSKKNGRPSDTNARTWANSTQADNRPTKGKVSSQIDPSGPKEATR